MKNQHHYEIYNVFAESAWGGNPLAIVPDADALSTEKMQLIARQFNLSETVFICSSNEHTARLRIFAPDHEMPFAGHPTIGAAAWLHKNRSLPNQFTLMTNAKMVEINHDHGVYRLSISGYQSEPSLLNHVQLAEALGLSTDDVAPNACWMNAGTWQFIVPITNLDALNRARPNLKALINPAVEAAHLNAYLWFKDGDQIHSRYFLELDNSVIEDPGTGSACANLGAWAHMQNLAPLNWHITQAEFINRPNHLYLNVNDKGRIQVGGQVMPFSQGVFNVFYPIL
jgi:PhzF family phenazine biosynthesis protein